MRISQTTLSDWSGRVDDGAGVEGVPPVPLATPCPEAADRTERFETKERATHIMRRTFITFTAVSAALALAACNGDTAEDSATDADTPVVENTDDDTADETAEDAAGSTDDAADDGESTEDAAGTEAAGGLTAPVCADFFEGQGTPLAERAADQFEVVGSGDDLNPTSFSEVNLLERRIAGLVEDADGEHADLLERINAPFTEVVQAVTSEDAGTQDEITIPEVDTADAQAAVEELEAACAA